VKVGVVTDGYMLAQRKKLDAVGAESLFDTVVVSDEFGREFWKPHERPFMVARDQLGVGYHEMAYVGDNPQKDFAISARFPIHTVRIIRRRGHYTHAAYLRGIREQSIIYTLDDLPAVLDLPINIEEDQ
jgi:putative hydrolase of the HAD superfamily